MKLRPDIRKLIFNFLIWTLIIGALFFVAFIKIFVYTEWGYAQWIIIGVFLGLIVLLFIAMYFTTYYIIDKHEFKYLCLGKEMTFEYQKIHYIEAKRGKDSKTLGIYLSPTDVKYLTNDKNGVLYETLMDKCPELYDSSFINKDNKR